MLFGWNHGDCEDDVVGDPGTQILGSPDVACYTFYFYFFPISPAIGLKSLTLPEILRKKIMDIFGRVLSFF